MLSVDSRQKHQHVMVLSDKSGNTVYIDLGMYDHLIFCIHCSNNVLGNAYGRQDALAGKMFDKDWIPTK